MNDRRTIQIAAPELSGNESKYVQECIDTTWISSAGRFVHDFERAFADFCGVEHAVVTNNGTTALHLALTALDIGPGDEVIVPTLTYIASANAVRYCGATPVFADSEPVGMTIDADDFARKITPRTKAVMPVHLYGNVSNMAAINQIAAEHDIIVVEDAAEAHGARSADRSAGALGRCAAFSFFGNKIITTGEGGAVTTDDAELAARLRLLRGQGMDPQRRYWFPVVGFNYRMTNIAAALGLAQLEDITRKLALRKELAARYDAALENSQIHRSAHTARVERVGQLAVHGAGRRADRPGPRRGHCRYGGGRDRDPAGLLSDAPTAAVLRAGWRLSGRRPDCQDRDLVAHASRCRGRRRRLHLRAIADARTADSGGRGMKVIIATCTSPFIFGGATLMVDWLEEALQSRGHEVETYRIPVWTHPDEFAAQLVALRQWDFTGHGDRLIAIRTPSYLVRHHSKVVWFLHHLRNSYDLWDVVPDVPDNGSGREYRRMMFASDEVGLAECKTVFTNSQTVADRLSYFNDIRAEVLYPPLGESIKYSTGSYGDSLIYVSRVVGHKRQLLAVQALAHTRTPVQLIIAGKSASDSYADRIVERDRSPRAVPARPIPQHRDLRSHQGRPDVGCARSRVHPTGRGLLRVCGSRGRGRPEAVDHDYRRGR